jgi:hypothetical protein
MKNNIALATLSLALLSACGGSSNSNNLPQFSQSSLSLSVAEDTVLSKKTVATDQDGDAIVYSLANAATNGQVIINAKTGDLTYTPNPNFNGQDIFSIAAADAKGRTTQQISIDVKAVNDLPTIGMENVLVSGGEIKQGMVEAVDVDNDSLSYSIEKSPSNGTLTIDKDTGAISYQVTELQETKDSFTLGVSDGTADMVTKKINISASIASNIDRAYYYYASDKSRLKQAQTIADAQKNDQVKSNVYSDLVRGYALAGFNNKVEKLITAESIIDPKTRANALVSAADAYVYLGNNVVAKEYLINAQNLYNEVLVTNGIATLDAAFLIKISLIYKRMEDLQGQAQTFSLLDLLLSTLPDGVESQRLFFAYDRMVKDAISHWKKTDDEDDRLHAKILAERSLRLISKMGYVTNRDNVVYSSTTLIAYEYLSKEFYQLNEIDLSKDTLSRAFSLYGYVGYDDNYVVAPDQHAINTANNYVWALSDLSAQYVTLYPEANPEPLVEIVKDAKYFDFVKDDIIANANEVRMLAQVSASTTDEQALELAKAVRNNDNLRKYFSDIISYNQSSPGAAVRLIEQKRYSAAKLILDEGLALIQSNEYLAKNRDIYTFVSGDAGCNRIARLYHSMAKALPDSDYLTQAKSSAKICHDLVIRHYSKKMLDTDGIVLSSNEENTQAAAETAHLLAQLAMNDELTSILKVAETSLTLATDVTAAGKIQLLSQLGREMAEGGKFTLSQGFYDRAISDVLKLETSASATEQGSMIRDFYNGSRNLSTYKKMMIQLENQQLNIDNGPQIKMTAITNISNLFEKVMNLLAERSDIIKNKEYPRFAALFTDIGDFERATMIGKDTALNEVEKASVEVNIARKLALKDDFPSTLIASVDTDGDGMPNFFASFATQEMIAALNLVLDPDSDNDNVNDADDAFPLDATRQ